MVFRHILSTDEGPIRIVTINRPEFLNSINAEVCSELSEAITTAAASHTLRVIIITGAGDKAFVAGGDIRFMVSATPAQAVIISQAVKMLHDTIRRCAKPIIAAVNGHCLGGGLELAMACDIRIAARTARFGLPEIRLGIMPGGGGTARLARLVGSAAARALCMTGQTITAERAYSLGLVYDVVEPAEVMSAAKRLANELASYSEFAFGQLKSTLDKTVECDIETAEALETKAFALCFRPARRDDRLLGKAQTEIRLKLKW